jgi:hypothetical protein
LGSPKLNPTLNLRQTRMSKVNGNITNQDNTNGDGFLSSISHHRTTNEVIWERRALMNYDPILSIATATLEVGAAAWALRGPGRKPIIHTVSAMMIFLAAYQIIEAIFCTGSPVTLAFLPRMAFMVVAWLPPTGLLLVAWLYPSKTRTLYYYAYAMFVFCGTLVAGIAIDKRFVSATVCEIVFAIYTNPTPLYRTYGFFYQSGLMSMLLISAYGVTICEDNHQRLLLGQVLLGSIAFIFPSLLAVTALQVSSSALSSIMCHMALFLALFLMRLIWMEQRMSVGENAQQILDGSQGVYS